MVAIKTLKNCLKFSVKKKKLVPDLANINMQNFMNVFESNIVEIEND